MSQTNKRPISLAECIAVTAFLLLIFLIFFASTFIQGERIFLSVITDYSTLSVPYPWQLDIAKEMNDGYMPLWSSIHGLGVSAIGNLITAPFYPLNLPALFMSDYTAGLELSIILKFIIAGLGTYVLARKLGLGVIPSLMAATGFMFCGHLMKYVHHFNINGAVFSPIMFLGVLYIRERNFRVGTLLLVFSGLSTSLSGSAFDIFYSNLFTFLFALFLLFSDRSTRSWGLLLMTILGQVLGLLGGGLVLLPFLETLSFSWNYHPPASSIFHYNIRGAFAMFMPWLIGKHRETVLSPIMPDYHGIIIFLLSLSYFLKPVKTTNAKVFFLLLILLICGMIFGIPPFHYLNFLPAISRINNTTNATSFFGLFVSLVAAFSLDEIIKKPQNFRVLWKGIIALTIAIIISAFYGRYIIGEGLLVSVKHLADLKFSVFWSGLILAFCSTLFFLTWKAKLKKHYLTLFILILSLLGLYVDKSGLNPDPQHLDERMSSSEAFKTLKSEIGFSRAYVSHTFFPPNSWEYHKITGVETGQGLQNKRYVNFMCILNRIPTDIDPIDNLKLMQAFLKTHFIVGILPESLFRPLTDLLSARYILLAVAEMNEFGGLEMATSRGFRILKRDNRAVLIENPNALPRAYFSERWVNAANEQEALDIITGDAIDFRKVPVIESSNIMPPESTISPVSKHVDILSLKGSIVEIETSSPEPGYLVLTDHYWPGWKARVDGIEKKIDRANYLYRGVWLKRGKHKVTFTYEPMSFKIGLWGSITSIISALIFIIKLK